MSYKSPITPGNTPGSPSAGLSIFPAAEDHDHGLVIPVVTGGGGSEPLTNGDVDAPELIFADGDVIMA